MLPLRMLGPLILMLLLCGTDADSTCPDELNPLSLGPPHLIVEYMEWVVLNCTSTEENHDGMYFVGTTEDDMEEDKNFIIWSGPLSDWTVKPECRIKLNETFECRKVLEITMYKTPDLVSVSGMDALMVEDMEYELTCDIIAVAPVQNLRVKWYLANNMVHTQMYNDTTDTSIGPVNVSSVLSFTASKYYNAINFQCEAELLLGPKGPELIPTKASLPYTAVVLYEPLILACQDRYVVVENKTSVSMLPCIATGNPRPTVQWFYQEKTINASEPLTRTQSGKYTAEFVNRLGSIKTSVSVTVDYAPEFKSNTEDVFVYEGTDLSLACEAEGNPSPVFNWTCNGVDMTVRTNKLTLTHATTNANCSCTAGNYLGSPTKLFHVEIVRTTAGPHTAAKPMYKESSQLGCPLTLMPAEVVVRFGDPVSINCSTSAADFAVMGWEAAIGGTITHMTSTTTWTVEKLDMWSIKPKCFVTLTIDQCSVTPNITLYKTPDLVSVSAMDAFMMRGREYQLTCDIVAVAPVQNLRVKWYRGHEMVHTQMFNDTSVTPVNVSSTLSFTARKDFNGARFRCEAELLLGPKGPELIPTKASLPYTAVVLYEPLILACQDRYVVVENETSVSMLPCNATGNPRPTVQWFYQEKTINASEPLTRTQSGKYTAEFVNRLGSIKTSVSVTVEYNPSLTCNDRYEVLEEHKLQTECDSKGIPEPEITWIRDGKKMATPQRWTKDQSGEYLLRATNKHGTTSQMLYIDVLYAPVFKEANHTVEVTPGKNVTFECSAEGNPAPEIHWEYISAVNVNTTGGRQKNISVTGATSTNAGVYVCVATNKVRRVARSVTVLMKGQSSAFPPVLFWGLIIALIIVCTLLALVVYRSCRKQKEQYNFVPDRDALDRSIPMTPASGEAQA